MILVGTSDLWQPQSPKTRRSTNPATTASWKFIFSMLASFKCNSYAFLFGFLVGVFMFWTSMDFQYGCNHMQPTWMILDTSSHVFPGGINGESLGLHDSKVATKKIPKKRVMCLLPKKWEHPNFVVPKNAGEAVLFPPPKKTFWNMFGKNQSTLMTYSISMAAKVLCMCI